VAAQMPQALTLGWQDEIMGELVSATHVWLSSYG
jgi:hypothetical protein